MDNSDAVLIKITEDAIRQLVQEDCESNLSTIKTLEDVLFNLWVNSNSDFMKSIAQEDGWMWGDYNSLGETMQTRDNSVGPEMNDAEVGYKERGALTSATKTMGPFSDTTRQFSQDYCSSTSSTSTSLFRYSGISTDSVDLSNHHVHKPACTCERLLRKGGVDMKYKRQDTERHSFHSKLKHFSQGRNKVCCCKRCLRRSGRNACDVDTLSMTSYDDDVSGRSRVFVRARRRLYHNKEGHTAGAPHLIFYSVPGATLKCLINRNDRQQTEVVIKSSNIERSWSQLYLKNLTYAALEETVLGLTRLVLGWGLGYLRRKLFS